MHGFAESKLIYKSSPRGHHLYRPRLRLPALQPRPLIFLLHGEHEASFIPITCCYLYSLALSWRSQGNGAATLRRSTSKLWWEKPYTKRSFGVASKDCKFHIFWVPHLLHTLQPLPHGRPVLSLKGWCVVYVHFDVFSGFVVLKICWLDETVSLIKRKMACNIWCSVFSLGVEW